MRFYPWVLMMLVAFCALPGNAGEARENKMCWAHYVSWGFDQVGNFDEAGRRPEGMLRPFADRSLLGTNIQWDTGIFFAARRQIESAMANGVDGFCVDVYNPESWIGMLESFYRDAEGTDFKIALCIDSLGFDNDRLLKNLDDFIRAYQDHPNASRIDGRMVIFIYNLGGKDMTEWKAVRAELAQRGLDAYYLVQPMHETTMWDKPAELEAALQGFDGLYDFGCNGFTPEQMKQRFANARAAMEKVRPESILVGGVTVGYLGQANGCYRPFMNSRTLRDNWAAVLEDDSEWVCLTTWNDYGENTQFAPSVVNRDNLLLINREFVNQWRGTASPERPARVIFNYHEEAVIGDDVTIEVLNFSYSGKPAQVALKLLDMSGKILREYPAMPLNAKALTAQTIRIPHEELSDWRIIRLQAAVTNGNAAPNFLELHPIVRRFGRLESVRTVRVRYDDLVKPAVVLGLNENGAATVEIDSWLFAGKVELLRNGFLMEEREISHSKAPKWQGVFALPEVRRSTEDVYLVRVTDVSGRVGFSNPVLSTAPFGEAKSVQPVIVSGSDYDENWPLWPQPVSRFPRPRLERVSVADHELFDVVYDFAAEADDLISCSGWKVPARPGNSGGYGWHELEKIKPEWVSAPGPDGSVRTVVAFDGKENAIAMAVRTMPYGPFTIEFLVNPEKKDAEMFLFQDQADVSFALDAELRPVLRRGGGSQSSAVAATESLVPGKWAHVAGVYDGETLRLYINGKAVGQVAAPTRTMPINSVGRIGNTMDLNRGFLGQLAGFRLTGAVRTPAEFKLLKK